ncbi:membrane protein [Microbacterium nanhaiense]|uniref:Membrane protein n=1 Tax=Microbacterium nanhaiense TaxID=1301026 RepID=A0ABQ2N211_9MICO|nr:stage II sporulation protein M [Microbacterium nanhaiense]GGO62930.1 membrane protein [Microbacterium nanhaiense]
MNLDAMVDERRAEWERLDALARRKRLTGAEVDEFVHLYRSASADLAGIKTAVGRSPVADHLSGILSRARLKITGAPDNMLRQVPRFFARQLPAALYRIRWLTLAVTTVFVAIVALIAWWMQQDPAYMAAMGDETQLRQYAESDFADYYSDHPETVFAGMVWSNNAWIAAQTIMFGITGIWPVYVIAQNAVGLGTSAAVMNWYGHGDDFILLILPHGLLEMTSIFVAGAAGLRIFWAWIAPGARSRGSALASEGRALATVVVGLMLSLAVSGVIEGFVTRQEWHPAIKIGIGALALAAFLFYMLVIGGRAARDGETGDLTEYEAGTTRLVSG